MAVQHKITRSYTGLSGTARTYTETVSGANNEVVVNDTVPKSTTDQHTTIALTRANLKSLMLYSSLAVTLCTNAASTGSPQETIQLQAGIPLIWSLAQDGLTDCPFSGNITGFYWTNASGTTDATVEVQATLAQ